MKLQTHFKADDYTNYVIAKYDLQVEDNTYTDTLANIDLNELNTFEWHIGLIVGNSGSGKTTLLKQIGYTSTFEYDETKPVISQFTKLTPQEASDLLLGVGLCSIPKWLQQPNTLSTGEFARFEIAKRIYDASQSERKIALLDEFTSTVNRMCGKSIARALNRLIMGNKGIQLIIASCHFDMIEELKPDWIINTNERNVEVKKLNYISMQNNVNNENLLTSIYEIL